MKKNFVLPKISIKKFNRELFMDISLTAVNAAQNELAQNTSIRQVKVFVLK